MMTTLSGRSGTQYNFEVFELGTTFNEVPCVYVYASNSLLLGYFPVYIGKTIHLQTRMNEHANDGIERCARTNHASHILVHRPSSKTEYAINEEIEKIELDLLSAFNTPCNTQNN